MQKVIDHHSVKATRAELILSDDKPYRVLHIDSRLVLTPGVPSYSEEAVFGSSNSSMTTDRSTAFRRSSSTNATEPTEQSDLMGRLVGNADPIEP